jgi:phosphatidylserine/phosphatidylglycerophosphate/cardiolipin synthase-like enzyme
LLLDNQAYYAALGQALQNARRSIHMLGWAFDPRTRFSPDGTEGPVDPDEIGRILLRLVEARPDLDVRLLIWDSQLAINGAHGLLEHRAKQWFAGTPIRFRLDGDVPFGACHHQKVIVVDDQVAFCGGGDIVTNRWDTRDHLDDDPRRLLPDQARHPPRHEVTMIVEGPVACDLGDLFRARWERATGEAQDRPETSADSVWPEPLSPNLDNVEVAIARTEPGWKGRPRVDEILRLTLAAIAEARRTIYLENQYFTSPEVTEALALRLAEPDGPEVVLVVSAKAPSWFDRLTMDHARNPRVRRLMAADIYGRFRAYCPVTASGRPIIVHAKLGVCDDQVFWVGSANLNNRSAGFDTECVLAISASDAPAQHAIAGFRDRLLGHFLGVEPGVFAATSRVCDGLAEAIETLNRPARLVALAPGPPTAWERLVSAYSLGDPSDASDSWRPLRRRRNLHQAPKV